MYIENKTKVVKIGQNVGLICLHPWSITSQYLHCISTCTLCMLQLYIIILHVHNVGYYRGCWQHIIGYTCIYMYIKLCNDLITSGIVNNILSQFLMTSGGVHSIVHCVYLEVSKHQTPDQQKTKCSDHTGHHWFGITTTQHELTTTQMN